MTEDQTPYILSRELASCGNCQRWPKEGGHTRRCPTWEKLTAATETCLQWQRRGNPEPPAAERLRDMLRAMKATNARVANSPTQTAQDKAALARMRLDADALQEALELLGWLYEPQSILDAG